MTQAGNLEERFNKRVQWRQHRREIMQKTTIGSYRVMESAKPSITYNSRKAKARIKKEALK